MRELKNLYEEISALEEKIEWKKRPFNLQRAAIAEEEEDVLGLLPERLTGLGRSIEALQGTMKASLRSEAGIRGLQLSEGGLQIRVSRSRMAYTADIAKCIESVDAIKPLQTFWYPGQEKKSLDRIVGEWMVEQAANGTIQDSVVEDLVTEIAASTQAVSFTYKE